MVFVWELELNPFPIPGLKGSVERDKAAFWLGNGSGARVHFRPALHPLVWKIEVRARDGNGFKPSHHFEVSLQPGLHTWLHFQFHPGLFLFYAR